MQLSTVHRLPDPRQSTKDSDPSVSVVTNTTSSMMRVTTMTSGTICPDRGDSFPVDQGGFMMPDDRYPGRRQQAMQLNTRRHCL
eukprot:292641-Amphidinium_carterae.1